MGWIKNYQSRSQVSIRLNVFEIVQVNAPNHHFIITIIIKCSRFDHHNCCLSSLIVIQKTILYNSVNVYVFEGENMLQTKERHLYDNNCYQTFVMNIIAFV